MATPYAHYAPTSPVDRLLMLDAQIHPDMTLAEFHQRHGISYDLATHEPPTDPDRSGGQ